MGKVIEANTDLRVIEHNPYWVVVSKPAPLIAHPTSLKKEPSLWGELSSYFREWGYDVSKTSIVNRLDRETSGITLIAIDRQAARIFGKMMVRKEFHKLYYAIVYGHPEWDECRVTEPILPKQDVETSAVWVRQCVHPKGKACETQFDVERRFENQHGRFSLLKVRPKTGRMHQIRVHCEWLGFPIVGDKIYGKDERHYLEFIENGWNREMSEQLLMRRQALHASELQAGDGVWSWRDELPADMAQFLSGDL